MLKMKRLLAFGVSLLAISPPATALTGNQRIVLFGSSGYFCNYLAGFCGGESFSRSSIATYINASNVLTTAAANVPRFDYTGGSAQGLLLEATATNLVLQSGFASSWTNANSTVTASAVTGPDNTTSAATMNDGATATTTHGSSQTVSSLTASVNYTFCVAMKQGTGRYVSVGNAGSTTRDGGYAVFDLQAGTVTQSAALAGGGTLTSATISAYPEGYWRTCVTAISANAARFVLVSLANAATFTADTLGRQTYTGGSNVWDAFGADLEKSATPTSYVATTSPQTRAADSVTPQGALAAAIAAGPTIIETKNEATGVIARSIIAKGGTVFQDGFWYRQICAYGSKNPSTAYLNAHLTVGGPC
jgi:hypothetical protein